MKDYKREYYIQNKDRKEKHPEEEIQKKNQKKEYDRAYYLLNKEKKKEYCQKYSIQNRDKMKEYFRDYYIQNKEKKKEYKREYYHKSIDKIKEYKIKNKEKINQYFRKKNIEKQIEKNDNYVPLNSWKTNELIREFFEKIAPVLHINDLSDWYRISREQIIDLKGIIVIIVTSILNLSSFYLFHRSGFIIFTIELFSLIFS